MTTLHSIAKHLFTAILVASLHFPVAYSYIHLFINNNHTECREYSKVHFHKQDTGCFLLHTLKPSDHNGFRPVSVSLFAPQYSSEPAFSGYFLRNSSPSPYFLRRGPPSFS
ncbi:MAG: hypothetical protein KDD04_10220 [Sinomicrobium sp.]|nr:hypothetical protein [Sinomicrobium sp.]